MKGSGRRRAAALVLTALAALTACSDGAAEPSATVTAARLEADCRTAVDTLLATTQRYLDSIDATSADSAPSAAPAPSAGAVPDPARAEAEFTEALSNIRGYAGRIGCDPATFRDDLAAGLGRLTTGGPVANAVLLQLRADTGGQQPTSVPAGGDVAAVVAGAPEGAVVTLEPGEHVLPETLVLLRGVTLRGAGRDATTLRSAAPGGVVLVLTGDPVTLEGLTLTRPADAPGSVVSAAPTATLSITGVRVSGARANAEGKEGVGVLMAAGQQGQSGPSRRTSVRFTDSEAVDNAVAGLVVSGEHRAEVVRSGFERNGQCGICFLATTDGTVADSRFAGNAAGVVAAGDARPVVSGGTVDGGEVGVQALERAAPQVTGVTVRGARRAAFLFADQSAGAVRGSSCVDVPFGIVVGPQAAPEVDGNTGCDLARGQ